MDTDTTSQTKPDLTAFLGRHVHVVIDRPLGSTHPRQPDIIYPVNYGYIPGTMSGDGLPLDVYLLGPAEPLAEANGVVVAVVVRSDDLEDKLIVVRGSESPDIDIEEIRRAVYFQEKYFDSYIVIAQN